VVTIYLFIYFSKLNVCWGVALCQTLRTGALLCSNESAHLFPSRLSKASLGVPEVFACREAGGLLKHAVHVSVSVIWAGSACLRYCCSGQGKLLYVSLNLPVLLM
jgi:hypothetical protein